MAKTKSKGKDNGKVKVGAEDDGKAKDEAKDEGKTGVEAKAKDEGKTKVEAKAKDDGKAKVAVVEDAVKNKKSNLYSKKGKLKKRVYEKELERLQYELVKLQYWIKEKGLKVCVVFEGRDAAGKGGVIKRITQRLNPRIVRVVALGTPSDKEKEQWYFQRYANQLPTAGEMVLFDRSWYNRAGVERVMGFCTDSQYREFLRSCPQFERMLVNSGIILIKYWFSVSDAEQERRFRRRNQDPLRRWKLSPMDLKARTRWVEYSRAKDAMFMYTDIEQAPWYVVNADVKRHARLNCITHLLNQIPYEDLTPDPVELPPRQEDTGYQRPPISSQKWVPAVWGGNPGHAAVDAERV